MRKKHLQRIEAWFNEYKEPPVKAIKGNRDHYAGLWIKPWYGLKKKNPPLPVFLEMLNALSKMYDEWDKAFKAAGEPYDLQLWIYDEHMIESQLVCAGVEKKGDRRTNYFHNCPEQYKFQSGKYTKDTYFDPEDFEWTTYEVRDYLYEKIDGLSDNCMKKMLTLDWREETYHSGLGDEQRAFWRIYDFVWVGRKK
jgi:hypothetical protein